MINDFRKREKKKATKKGVILITASLSFAIILFIFIALNEKVKLDKNNCPIKGIEAKTVVLLDTSDPLTDIQILKLNGKSGSLLKQFEDTSTSSIINELGLGEQHQLSVWSMNEINKKPTNLGRICNPGQVDSGDFFKDAQTGRLIKLANFEKFKEFITNLFPKNLDKMSKKNSPIIYSLNYISTYEFGEKRKLFTKEKPNRIVIISDMIENGKKISHFQVLPKISDVKKINLKNLIIHVRNLKKDQYKKIQTKDHRLWWIKFFNKSDASAIGWKNW